ncbi:hypothetical protein GH733_006543 [Mirounga leonina]|nr:hypothetical protein GH733_006543 [Mirounga leonina]
MSELSRQAFLPLDGRSAAETVRLASHSSHDGIAALSVRCGTRAHREGTKVVQPIFLGKIINYFENHDPTNSVALHEAYMYATVLTICTLILAILHHLYFYHVQCAGMRLRVAMCHMIYRKGSGLRGLLAGARTCNFAQLCTCLWQRWSWGPPTISNLATEPLTAFNSWVFTGLAVGALCTLQGRVRIRRSADLFGFLAESIKGEQDALRLSNVAMGKTTTGQIVNLLSNDVNKFDQVTIFLHFLWAGPLQAIAVTALLWMEIGISCLAGIAVLIILLPLQSCLGKLFSSFRSKTATFTDVRIRTMNEVITGIRIIKMYAWEKSFADLITYLRRKEISKILSSSYLRGMNLASFFVASKIIIFVTFTTYVLLGNVITASHVFVAVSLYGAVRLTVTLFFPAAIEKVSEANFLLLDEISQRTPQLPSDGKMIVHVQDFTAFWDKASETPTLQGLSFTVRPGELLAVIGPVGAGKSSLLSAVLGELPRSQGLVSVHGRIAYVSQQPWVFSGTVRSNILFGKKYEKERYEKVIKACALKKDLQLLEDGDLTVIGDRGATLSGGQKARINLARAVYQDADIYLLDDPLSAVDAEVGRHFTPINVVFAYCTFYIYRCICQTLHEKITILVTHQLQYLKAASQILILKDGKMVQKGTYTEFLKSGVDFGSLLKKENEEADESPALGSPTLRTRSFSESSVWSQQSSRPSLKDGAPEVQANESAQVAVSEESRSEGKVGLKAYKNYLTAGAHWLAIVFLILLNIIAQVAYILQDWWLSYWANEQSALNVTVNGKENVTEKLDLAWYLGIYSGLTGATVLFGTARSLFVFYVLVHSSQTLHNKMFESILRAPVLFFDRNPIGKSDTKFSQSVGLVDTVKHLITFQHLETEERLGRNGYVC